MRIVMSGQFLDSLLMMFSNVSYSLEADAKEREECAFLMFSDYNIEEVQKGQLCICIYI